MKAHPSLLFFQTGAAAACISRQQFSRAFVHSFIHSGNRNNFIANFADIRLRKYIAGLFQFPFVLSLLAEQARAQWVEG